MSSFIARLDDSLEYYIYGAGTLGKLVGEYLLKEDVRIQGYIDKRAMEVKTLIGISVYDLNVLKKNYVDNICIIIAIKDVFEHEKIKQTLFKLGVNKIIYKAQNVLDGNGSQSENIISQIYDSIINHSFMHNTELPLIFDEGTNKEKKEWILCKDEEQVTAYVPCELIYTNYDEKKEYTWGDVCILGLVPHIDLFKFFAGNTDYSEELYINFCIQNAIQQGIEITESWKKNVIRNRNNVFRQMFYYWSMERDFFVRNAPTAKWNENGYFNLTSGKHRAAFLVAMGQRWIPCKVAKEDYEEWKKVVDDNSVSDMRDYEYQMQNDILSILEYYICKESLNDECKPCYKKKKVYIDYCDNGYIQENLCKFGLEVTNQAKHKLNSYGEHNSYEYGVIVGHNEEPISIISKIIFLIEEDKQESLCNGKIIYENYYGDKYGNIFHNTDTMQDFSFS